ncbi:MAG: hypothetical protein ACTSRR_09310 [Candidatus Heimdallarchaeaceae archaeon]
MKELILIMFEKIAFSISILSLILSGITVYYSFFWKKAKLSLSGPVFNPQAKEWGVYISNVGNTSTLLFLLDVHMIFDERKISCYIRPKQDTYELRHPNEYELRHPNEYKLFWIKYPQLHKKDVEHAKVCKICIKIKYFTGKKFKVFKKKAPMPKEEFERFLSTLV